MRKSVKMESTDLEMSQEELRALLKEASQEGAEYALHAIGLSDEQARNDVSDMRALIKAWRETKTEARKTVVNFGLKLLLTLLIVSTGFKLAKDNHLL